MAVGDHGPEAHIMSREADGKASLQSESWQLDAAKPATLHNQCSISFCLIHATM